MSLAKAMTDKLTAALAPEQLVVRDDTARHRGHAGVQEMMSARGASAPPSETHFDVLIVSAAFRGLGRVSRQRRVYDIVADELKAGVHALALRTLTPEEAAAQQQQQQQ